MNEWKIYTRFYLEKPTQKRENRTKWQVQQQNKKIINRNDPIQYPDGAVTMDEDCDCTLTGSKFHNLFHDG